MPALSHVFHLSPNDIWDMDEDVFDAYLEALEQVQEETRG